MVSANNFAGKYIVRNAEMQDNNQGRRYRTLGFGKIFSKMILSFREKEIRQDTETDLTDEQRNPGPRVEPAYSGKKIRVAVRDICVEIVVGIRLQVSRNSSRYNHRRACSVPNPFPGARAVS